jgi:hypothetical protein
MANTNSQPPSIEFRLPELSRGKTVQSNGFIYFFDAMMCVLLAQPTLLCLLAFVDLSRCFMVSGSSYIWPQLFSHADTVGFMSPTTMNIVASFSPMVGLVLGGCAIFSARRMTMLGSLIATVGFGFLTNDYIRTTGPDLLACVIMVKLTYGPLHASINLMKAESFPTEIRATAFSVVSIAANAGGMAAPTLAEIMKGESWTAASQTGYMKILMAAILSCGLVAWMVPAQCGDGAQLEDLGATAKKDDERSSKDVSSKRNTSLDRGSLANVWPPSRDSSLISRDSMANGSTDNESSERANQIRRLR